MGSIRKKGRGDGKKGGDEGKGRERKGGKKRKGKSVCAVINFAKNVLS